MAWFRWWGRWRKQRALVAPNTAPRPIYVPGRETVTTGASHYVLPNDLRETSRLDLQHLAMYESFGTNVFAPVRAPKRILDVACGTGRWAKEVAQQFPEAQVTGIDISIPLDIQEQAPSREYTFVQANLLEPLPFPEAQFDYVHMRFVFSAVPAAEWPVVVRELVRVTAPGGWVELVEAHTPIAGGAALAQIEAWARQLLAKRGIDMELGQQVGAFLRGAGVESVTERSRDLPMGPYGGRIGQIIGVDMFTAFRTMMRMYIQGLGLEEQEVQATIAQADADVYQGQAKSVFPVYIAFGQRPGGA
jgi:SAM-dependent methyltransferase